MTELIKITQGELLNKRLSGLDDTPRLSAPDMQARFDAHPDKNTEVINQHALVQNQNNLDLERKITVNSNAILEKVSKEVGKGLSTNDFSNVEKEKLKGIENNANKYVLPIATGAVLGGVKQGYGVEIMPDGTLNGYSSPAPDEFARGEVEKLKENLSNPNLLINGDFQIWQRENSFSLTDTYKFTSDRWWTGGSPSTVYKDKFNGSDSVIITQNGVNAGKTWINFSQPIENPDRFRGKTITISSCLYTDIPNVSLYIWIKKKNQSGMDILSPNSFNVGAFSSLSYTYTFANEEIEGIYFGILVTKINSSFNGKSLRILWIKAELGSAATAFVPRSYGEELSLCQRYYRRINCANFGSLAFALSNTNNTAISIFEIGEMRIRQPSLKMGGNLYVSTPENQITSLSINGSSNYCVLITFMVNGGLTMGNLYLLTSRDKEGYIELDAEFY